MENNIDNKPVRRRKTAPQSYTEAVAELETIVNELRKDSCDVDTLAEKASRATLLLRYCKDKLTATDEQLRKSLEELAGQSR